MHYDESIIYRVHADNRYHPDATHYTVEAHYTYGTKQESATDTTARYNSREALPLWLQEKLAVLDLVAPKGLVTGIGTVSPTPNGGGKIYWVGVGLNEVDLIPELPAAKYVWNKHDCKFYIEPRESYWHATTGSNNTLIMGRSPNLWGQNATVTATGQISGAPAPQIWSRKGKFSGLEQSRQAKKMKATDVMRLQQQVLEGKIRKERNDFVRALLHAFDGVASKIKWYTL